jgi:ribosomal protein S18 acetylase RimI-like enzyme
MIITLREATEADIDTLAALGRSTYTETYRHLPENDNENMDLYFEQVFTPQVILSAITDPNITYRLAVVNGEVAGYLKVIRYRTEKSIALEKVCNIDKVYVRKAFHGQGIGKLLLEKAFEIAQTEGFEAIWLSVWQVNKNAVEFYQKFGFKHIGFHDFKMGNEVYHDWLMVWKPNT